MNIEVKAGGSLQAAIDQAKGGDTIYVEPSTFGSVRLPEKGNNDWIAIRASNPGQRYSVISPDYQPAIQTVGKATNWRFEDIYVGHANETSQGLIVLGDNKHTTVEGLASGFEFERLKIVSEDDGTAIISPRNQNTKRGIELSAMLAKKIIAR